MDFRDTPDEAAVREDVRTWLAEHFVGEFRELSGWADASEEDSDDLRLERERVLGAGRWVGMAWPLEYGGRALDFGQQALGERAMRVLGRQAGLVAGTPGKDYELDELTRLFMVGRSETIYAGASEIQRNIVGQRVLGLPREHR